MAEGRRGPLSRDVDLPDDLETGRAATHHTHTHKNPLRGAAGPLVS